MFARAHCNLLPRCRRHVCPRAQQLAPHALPRAQYGQEPWPCLCQRSNMGSWPHLCPKNCGNCMAPSTQSHHCSTVQRGVLCLCARGPGTSRTSYVYTFGGSTAPPLPAIKLSRTFCMDAGNFAPLRTNSCGKAFAALTCWRLTRMFGKYEPSIYKA